MEIGDQEIGERKKEKETRKRARCATRYALRATGQEAPPGLHEERFTDSTSL
jgi:hypothetical protein